MGKQVKVISSAKAGADAIETYFLKHPDVVAEPDKGSICCQNFPVEKRNAQGEQDGQYNKENDDDKGGG